MSRASEKTFDAVQMMRKPRGRLSQQIKDMSFEEEQRFIKARLCDGRAPNSAVKAREGDS